MPLLVASLLEEHLQAHRADEKEVEHRVQPHQLFIDLELLRHVELLSEVAQHLDRIAKDGCNKTFQEKLTVNEILVRTRLIFKELLHSKPNYNHRIKADIDAPYDYV